MEERLEKFIEYTAGTNGMFFFTCRIKRCKVTELTCEDLVKINTAFPELNIDWLITGRGSMLCSNN